jgi:energy-coupling factor transporter transmembrane protein EcfT
LPNDLIRSISLLPDNLSYNGSRTLSQFNVMDTAFSLSLNGSRLHVDIKLKRIISYHLTNTYLPTITLLIIAEVTLQFDESKTELSAGLSLTIMLVMYTMYESISEALVKTAYLKMIDYWLLFCLLTPFVIFMIEIFWLLERPQNINESTKGWIDNENVSKRKVIRYATYISSALFVCIYALIALLMHLEFL